MNTAPFVPESTCAAGAILRRAIASVPATLSKDQFLSAWFAIAYLRPGLHPDDFESAQSGWPHALKKFAADAWRRASAGELTDDELYPSDAAWSGLCDRLSVQTPDEAARRSMIANRSSRVD